MAEYSVTVMVHQIVDNSQLSKADKKDNPSGEYCYSITADDEDEACNMAMERFHNQIGIEHLDHFEIETHAIEEGVEEED